MTEEKKFPYYRRPVECPHCAERFFIDLDVEIGRVEKTSGISPDAWRDALSPGERDWLLVAAANGVLTSFVEALNERTESVPGNVEKYLLTWMTMAQPRHPPFHAKAALEREWGRSYQLWQAQNVVAVAEGGMLRAFAPLQWLEGAAVKNTKGITKSRVVDTSRVEYWIRTRFGYVPSGAATAQLLRSKSVGAFGRLVQ